MDCRCPGSGVVSVLTSGITTIMRSIWTREKVPEEWCEPVTVLIYEKGDKSSSEYHKGISLLSITTKLLAHFYGDHFILTKFSCVRIKQVSDPVGIVLIEYSQILERLHTCRLMMHVFLDLKAPFGSVDRAVLWYSFSLNAYYRNLIHPFSLVFEQPKPSLRTRSSCAWFYHDNCCCLICQWVD